MKKIATSLIIGVSLMFMTGCAALAPFSTYNSNRVKENAIQEQIIAKNNPEQVRALRSGVSPRNVIRIIPTQDLKGAYAAVDLMNPDTWTFLRTFKEAPVSSTIAAVGDTTLWGTVIYLGTQYLSGKSGGKETNISVNNGSGSTVVNSDSNGNKTDIKTGGGNGSTTVVNNNSDGNTTTVDNSTPPPESP